MGPGYRRLCSSPKLGLGLYVVYTLYYVTSCNPNPNPKSNPNPNLGLLHRLQI